MSIYEPIPDGAIRAILAEYIERTEIEMEEALQRLTAILQHRVGDRETDPATNS